MVFLTQCLEIHAVSVNIVWPLRRDYRFCSLSQTSPIEFKRGQVILKGMPAVAVVNGYNLGLTAEGLNNKIVI